MTSPDTQDTSETIVDSAAGGCLLLIWIVTITLWVALLGG